MIVQPFGLVGNNDSLSQNCLSLSYLLDISKAKKTCLDMFFQKISKRVSEPINKSSKHYMNLNLNMNQSVKSRNIYWDYFMVCHRKSRGRWISFKNELLYITLNRRITVETYVSIRVYAFYSFKRYIFIALN